MTEASSDGSRIDVTQTTIEVVALVWRETKGYSEIAVVLEDGQYYLPQVDSKACSLAQASIKAVQSCTGCTAKISGIPDIKKYIGVPPKIICSWNLEVSQNRPSPNSNICWFSPSEAVKCLHSPEEGSLVEAGKPRAPSRTKVAFRPKLLPFFWGYCSLRYRRLSGALKVLTVEVAREVCKKKSEQYAEDDRWVDALLDQAQTALEQGKLDEGWKLFMAAARMRVYSISTSQIQDEASLLRAEAEKLKGWRQNAVFDLLGKPQKPVFTVRPDQLYLAMFLRDEHYSNQAFKDNLFKKVGLTLALILFCLIALITWSDILSTSPPNSIEMLSINLNAELTGVILFGLLGSSYSALVTIIRDPKKSSNIPEMVGAFRITFIRVTIGAASALAVYTFIKSGALGSLNLKELGPFSTYAISFASGFSERMVRKAVENLAGKDNKEAAS